MKIITTVIRKNHSDLLCEKLNIMQQYIIIYSRQTVNFQIKETEKFEKITIITEEEDVARIVGEIRRSVQTGNIYRQEMHGDAGREYICVQTVERLITLDNDQDSL